MDQLKAIDKEFVEGLKEGDRLFYFKDGSEDYILFTVIETVGDLVTLQNVFDPKEIKKSVTKKLLITDHRWKYNPEFQF